MCWRLVAECQCHPPTSPSRKAGLPDVARLATHLGMSAGERTGMLEDNAPGSGDQRLSEVAMARLSRVVQAAALAEEFLEDTAMTWLYTPRTSLPATGTAITPLALSIQDGGLDHLRRHFLQLRPGISP